MSTRLLPFAFAALSFAVPATAADRNFMVTDYTKIRVDGPYTVKLTTGAPPSAKATGSSTALDKLSVEVEGDTLVIRKNQSGWGGFPGDNPGPVSIAVGTHDLTAIWLNGSGGLRINAVKGPAVDIAVVGAGSVAIDKLAVDHVGVGVSGSGSVVLSGTANEASATASGTSSIDAHALTAKNATIGASGAAVVKLAATNTVKVNGEGAVTVELSGKPACTLNMEGPASVTGCR
ncbi:MAG: GIN domain-containing protein [Sphingomicrobium sp.]